LDDLVTAYNVEEEDYVIYRMSDGIPMGFVAHDDTKLAYVHIHLNTEIQYHPIRDETTGEGKHETVLFAVETLSMTRKWDGSQCNEVENIHKPIASCLKGPC
jgi:hypothetical protein